MFKQTLFQLHWLLGISAGLILAVVGVTGGVLSFEREILLTLNPQIMRVSSDPSTPFDLQQLLTNITQVQPDKRIASLTIHRNPNLAARVGFARGPDSKEKKGLDWYYVNPYTGVMLGKARGEEFFLSVMKLHRWLSLDEVGKQLVGASTCALIFFCISGLYLRWPRNKASLRTWLGLNFKHTGRPFLWELHAVVGTWCLLLYMLAAGTGLYWSYDWYRNGLFHLAGVSTPAPKPASPPAAVSMPTSKPTFKIALPNGNTIWSSVLTYADDYKTATLRFPETANKPVEIIYLPQTAQHERATNKLLLNSQTGELLKQDNYRDRRVGEQLINSVYALHTGSYFGIVGVVLMMLASLLMPLFTITGWLLYLDRRKKKRLLAGVKQYNAQPSAISKLPDMLIGFASQTGVAEQLAWRTAQLLKSAGIGVTVQPLAAINMTHLQQFQRALFVVSTFGEGGPPDSARHFSKLLNQISTGKRSLANLKFGLLALGDKQYSTFCQFGRQVEQWLHHHGATSLFKRIDVHQQDPSALELWHRQLAELAAITMAPSNFQQQGFSDWTLVGRHHLNPGSRGMPTYHLEFQPPQPTHWQAGDLFELVLPDLQTIRQYSIASHPSDGRLFLLVRQVINKRGELGPASNQLIHQLAIGASQQARIKSNPGFHLSPTPNGLILIGNGTGLAGLRSHLKARIEQGNRNNWLIFGERNQQYDNYYHAELANWKHDGWLAQLDLVFSRDSAAEPYTNQIYVQHRLLFYKDQVRQWVAEGAAILVSGSLQGMASGVDEALRDILGDTQVEQLIEQRRYLRDVY